ncbi:MAG: Ig-like domain-containing protein [Cytophagales bacterium]|nr:Ig-like domain-containing protein [Cytophagales bacterium]
MHRQISVPVLILVMSIGAYAQPNEVQDILVTPASGFGQANDIWQSFTPTQDGRLVKFTFDAGGNSPAGNRTVSIFEGEGTGGTLLQSFTYNFVGNTSVVSVTAEVDLPTPIPVTQGSQYTWSVTNINPRTLINTNPNTYTGGTGFATFNGTPFTNFDIGFSIILDIGTNVSIAARDEVSTTDPFIFDVTFYGTPTNLESTDFTITNGTVSGLSMASTEVYELSVSTTGDGTVTVDFPAGAAQVDGVDNDAATADAEVDLPPFQNPDLILSTSKMVRGGAQLFLNNSGIDNTMFFAPAGTTNFTTGATVTQGTTILVQDDPACIPQPAVMCGTDPITGMPDPPGCIPMPEVICTSSNQPVIYAPTDPGQYKLFLTDGSGNTVAESSTTLFVTAETALTTAAITVDDDNILMGETAEVTFVFLGTIAGFTNDDLTIPNGTLTSVSSSDGNITFTATFTPSSDVVDGSNVITLDNTGITSGAIAGTGTTDSENFAIDTGIPRVASILCTTGCDDVYTAAGSNRTLAIDVNFDRDVTLTGSMNLELEFVVANRSAIVTQNSAQSFTATYDLTQSDLNTQLDYTGTGALTLATASTITGNSNGQAADLTLVEPGAVGSISENRTIYIDLIPPQIVTILRQSPANEIFSGEEVTFRVAFTEDIEPTSFGGADFVLNGTAAGTGTVGTGQMVDSKTYDYTVTGLSGSNGTLGLTYNGSLTDLVTNNALSAAAPGTDQQYTLINTVPGFETTASGTSIAQGDDFNYDIEVSSNLNGAAYDISSSTLPTWLELITNDTIMTIAGTGSSGTTGNGGDALSAKFGPFLRDVTYDGDGNLYIVDRNNHMIRKVGTDNLVSQFAGTGSSGFSGDGSGAVSATLNFPSSIAFDDAGNAYIADDFNYRIRKVDASGNISTIAGNGTQGFSGDGGAATSAMINRPISLAVGPDGDLYIAEELRIRKVDLSTGDISTVAGNGTGTFVSGVTPSNSGFVINAIAIDNVGSIYIASQSHAVRKIDGITGLTSSIAGTGTNGFSGDGGAATSAQLDNPNAIAVDGDGNVFIAERENDRIRVIDKGGMIRTLGGNGVLAFSGDGGPATSAAILNPEGLAINENGRVIFSDAGNLRIRAIETNRARLTGSADQSAVGTHEITLTATNGSESVDQMFTIDVANVNDTPTLSPRLGSTTIATEEVRYDYITYVSDIDGDLVNLSVTDKPSWMSADLTTEVFTFVSSTGVTDLVHSDDQFFFTSQDNNAIYRVDNLGGSQTQIAGQANNSPGFTDGDGLNAAFETPFAIDAAANGDLYVIDQDNHALRKITDVDGNVTVTTIAGNGSAGNATGAASNATATFDTPTNVLVASNGDVYITDAGNVVIKKLSAGMITTLKDGSGVDFTFTQPYGLAMDDAGVLYVTDFGDHTVYSIDGTTRTLLAGTSATIGFTDGDGGAALFDEPAGITTNGDGSVLFVAESGNGQIRRLDIDGATVTVSTLASTLDTPVGMIQNPENGALLVADLGFNSITEHYHAITVFGNPTNEDVGVNTVEFTMNDGTADFTSELNVFVKNTNDAPEFTSTAPSTTTEDQAFTYTMEGTDMDGDAIAFDVTTLPDWLTFEASEFLVSTVAGDGSFTVNGDGGVATAAGIGSPDDLAADQAGNIYIAHENYIRKVDTDGNISTIIGDGTAANTGDSGPGVDAQITNINDLHVGPEGNLFISVEGAIRKLDINGMITSIAGAAGISGTAGTGDGGNATAATFNQNSGIFVDQDGNIFVADQSDNTVRKIDGNGMISTVATGVTFPFDIVVDKDGNIYAVNDGSTGLLKIDASDNKTDLTAASDIHFSTQDIAIDNLGNIYGTTSFSPANQIKVYNIDSDEVSIIANDDNTGSFFGDGGVASDAAFNTISAVAVGPDGSVFVADQNNGRIRKLTPQGPKITGTPTQGELGNHNIVLNVSDGTLSDDQSFTLTVNNLPEITNVTSTDGTYTEGDVLDIVVTFDGDVTSSGTGVTPSFALETGSADQVITQSANSGSTVTFTYTVIEGHNSSDLAYNSTSIDVGDYTIQSPAGVDADLTLPTVGAAGSLSANQAIVVDTEEPTLTNVSIASNNASNNLAREGDEITLSITSSEALSANPTVTIAGNTATVTSQSSTTYEATYTMTNNDTEGEVTLTINFADEAGNVGTEVTATTDGSTVTYDTTSPSVVLSSTVSAVTNATSFDLTITFSSDVSGFTIDDLTLSNADASNFSGSDSEYTVTLTPQLEGALSVDVVAAVAQDASGNGNVAATTFEVNYDATSPTVTLSTTDEDVNAAFEVSITFSESVTGFELVDLTVGNGVASDLSGSENSYTLLITPETEGDVTVNLAASSANDAAGNANRAATELLVNYDMTSPTPVLSTSSTNVNAAFTLTITFDESVDGFTVDDLTIDNGAASEFAGSETTYTATITPDAEGELTINVAASVTTDAAGNANSAASELSVNYDVTSPSPILSTASTDVNASFEVTITFDESVDGFTVDDLEIDNGAADDFSGTGTTFTATITPDTEGEVTVNVASSVATDAADNANTAASELSVNYDVTGPTPVISTASNDVNASFEVTITFDESVDGFTVDDLAIDNGAADDFSGTGTTFTATITPDTEGEVTVNVAASVTTDAAGNANSAASELSVNYDVTSPSPILSTASNDVNASFEVTITFDESVDGFTVDDLAIDNGAADDFSGTGTTYMTTITPDTEGHVTVNVASSVATDAAGNANSAASELSANYDVTGPTPVLSTASTDVNASFEVTITFDESVDGFTVDDLAIDNGAADDFSGTGTTYMATITPDTEGHVTVNVASSVATDAAGNANSAASELSVNYDVTGPTPVLSTASTDVNASFEVTITFDESIDGFTVDDLTIDNGVAGDFAGSGTTYTTTITPETEGEVTVNVVAAVATDAAGNANSAATELAVNYDFTPPTPTLSTSDTNVSAAFDVTITFDESVTGFELADLSVTNGLASDLSGSGTVYTVTITPSEEGSVDISIAEGVAADAAGNANTASNTLSVSFDGSADTTAPSVTLTTASTSVSGSFEIEITFSESVIGFELSDISVTNGSAADLEGSGSAYTATITPEEAGTVDILIAEGVATDAAENANTASNTLSVTFEENSDTTAPSVTLTTANTSVSGSFEIEITFSESVIGFELSDISVTNGAAAGLEGSGSTYTATITPEEAGTVDILIAEGVATDASENANTASNTLSVTFEENSDTTAPSVTLTTANTSVSGSFEIDIDFSESVTGFELSDISVTNGAAAGLEGSGSTYTATITPDEEGTVDISIAEGVVVDAAGNGNEASNTLSVTFDGTPDTTAPSVTITTANTSVSGAFEIEIAFSESVTGLELLDITVGNGTAGNLQGTGSVYSATITPTASGTVDISIAAGVVADAAGNANTASNSLSVEFTEADTTAPTVTIATASLEVSGEFEIMINFNEEVTGFEASDITIENGSLSGFTGSGSSYGAVVNPLETGTVTISIASGVATDAAGNSNEAGTLAVEAILTETTLSVGFNVDQVKVYPNPSSDFLYIESSLQVVQFSVFDLRGNRVLHGENGVNNIDVRDLTGGTYLLKILTKEESLSKLFLKK